MRMAAMCIALVSLLGLAAGNLVSPGLGKCLDIKADLKADNKTRETLDDMKKHTTGVNVQLYKCTGKHNQKFEVVNGSIRSLSLGWCLDVYAHVKDDGSRAKAANLGNMANVKLYKCHGKGNQNWDLTAFGYVRNAATGKCLDIVAAEKADGSREKFDEIKKHTTVNAQLFDCHDPETTERVNQLFEWAPVTGNGKMISAFEFRHLGFLKSSNHGHGAFTLALVGMAVLVAAGMFGFRMWRTSAAKSAQLLVGEE